MENLFLQKNWAINCVNNEYLFITDSSYIYNKNENYNSYLDPNKKKKIKNKNKEINLFLSIKQKYNNSLINNKMINEN